MTKTELTESLERIERLTAIQGRDTLTVKEAAMLYGRSEKYFRTAIAERQVPHYRHGGLVLLSKAELERWFKSERIRSEKEMQAEACAYIMRNPITKRK